MRCFLSVIVICLINVSCSTTNKYQLATIQEYDTKIHILLSRLEADLKLKNDIWSINIRQENGIEFQIFPDNPLYTNGVNKNKGYELYLSTYKNKELVVQTVKKCEELHHGIKFTILHAQPSSKNPSSHFKEYKIYSLPLGNSWEKIINLSNCFLDSEKGNIEIKVYRK